MMLHSKYQGMGVCAPALQEAQGLVLWHVLHLCESPSAVQPLYPENNRKKYCFETQVFFL